MNTVMNRRVTDLAAQEGLCTMELVS